MPKYEDLSAQERVTRNWEVLNGLTNELGRLCRELHDFSSGLEDEPGINPSAIGLLRHEATEVASAVSQVLLDSGSSALEERLDYQSLVCQAEQAYDRGLTIK